MSEVMEVDDEPDTAENSTAENYSVEEASTLNASENAAESHDEQDLNYEAPLSPVLSGNIPPSQRLDDTDTVSEVSTLSQRSTASITLRNESSTPCPSPAKKKRSCEVLEDDKDCQLCPICFVEWSTSGEHRLCALKCGHLFGFHCIKRWLLMDAQDPRCPTCKDKADTNDIRYIFARKIVAMDDSELTRMRKTLEIVTQEKNRLQVELATTTCRMHLLKEEVEGYKRKMSSMKCGSNENEQYPGGETVTLYKEKTIDLGRDSNCRVLDSKSMLNIVAVSVKSTNSLCVGYGVKLINIANLKPTAFIFLHSQMIRDIKFHESKPWLMSCSIDKDVKILDVNTNQTSLTLKGSSSLWSCCWDTCNENILYAGQQQGSTLKFDIRKPTEPVQTLFIAGDYSPVVSVQAIRASHSIFPLGGVISCKLTSIWAFENTPQESERHFLPVEGPFVSLTSHNNHDNFFLSSRPNTKYPYARHFLCELSRDGCVRCNIVHTLRGGSTQRMLSRTCLLSNKSDYAAAYIEDQRIVSLWNVNNANKVGSVPARETVLDINSVRTAHADYLLTLTESKLRFFKFNC
ncbi:hypothetical protein Trydic_g2889 [Trypoxylus dichotomus]